MDVLPEPDETPTEAYGPRMVRRRVFWIVAALAALAVLGAGAIAAHQLTHQGTTALREPGTGSVPLDPDSPWYAPSGTPGSPSASVSARASASASASARASASASASARASASGSARASAAPRATASPAAGPAPALVGPSVSADAIHVTNTGSISKDHHMMRVVSARGDLTGQRELDWIADNGHPVGDARCTQNFRIGLRASPRVRPTMLICWRTSAARSVYTVDIDVDGPPSEAQSVAMIDRVWSTLG